MRKNPLGQAGRGRVPNRLEYRRRTGRARSSHRRCAYHLPARAAVPAFRAAPTGFRAMRRSAPGRRGDRRRYRYGARADHPRTGCARARNTAPATPRAATFEDAGGFDEGRRVFASSSLSIGATRVAMSARGSRQRSNDRAQLLGRDAVGKSLCRLTTTSCRPCGSSVASAACTRSDPDGRNGSVITAMAPAARTASAISGSAQATATGPISASWPRRSTCTIIGTPWISASGLPGSRVEAMREGMMTIGCKGGTR